MNRIAFCATLLAGLLGFGQSSDPDPAIAMAARAEQVRAWIADLDSEDVGRREDAWASLLATGGEAIPYLLDSIRRKGASQQLKVLERLVQEENEPLPAELRMTPEDLKELINARAASKLDRDRNRAYMHAKFLDAVALYKERQYFSALEIARAIQKLEPALDFNDTIVKLKKACEQGIVQSTLVRARSSVSQNICQDGQMLKFTFELTNMTTGPVTAWLGDPALRNNPEARAQIIDHGSQLVVDFMDVTCDPEGASAEAVTTDPQALRRYSIELKPGETVKLATVERMAVASNVDLKKLRARGRLRLQSVEGPGGGFDSPLELLFEEAEVRVFPGNLAAAQQGVLQSLFRSIDAGDSRSTWLFSNLIGDADRAQATEVLMQALGHQSATETDHRILRNCLTVVTGRVFSSNDEWVKWHREQAKK